MFLQDNNFHELFNNLKALSYVPKEDLVQFYFEIIMPAFDTAMGVDENLKNMTDDFFVLSKYLDSVPQ